MSQTELDFALMLNKKVEQNLSALKTSAEPKAQELVQQTETLLADLKAKNGERSLTEIVKEKLVDQLISKPKPAQCTPPSSQQP